VSVAIDTAHSKAAALVLSMPMLAVLVLICSSLIALGLASGVGVKCDLIAHPQAKNEGAATREIVNRDKQKRAPFARDPLS
jgi:hypothetical protein